MTDNKTAAENEQTETSKIQKEAIEVVKVEKKPEEDLKVLMGRQNCDYWTTPGWPDWDQMTKPINYVMRGDGIWEVRLNQVGIFCVKRCDAKFPGFPKETNVPFYVPRHGRIPYSLLQEIVFFFKKICDDSKDEVYMQIFWDPEEKQYYNYCPIQEVSGASVDYKRDPELESNHVLVLEIHSHNTMGAYFSSVDDNDEKGDRFYGVVGELNRVKPAMKFSYVCGGTRVIIDPADLFEEAPEEEELFPQEWLKRVTKKSYQTTGTSRYSSYTKQTGTAYRHQPSSSGYGSHHGQTARTTNQSGTTTSAQTSRANATEIEAEIEKAAQKAQKEIDTSLRSCDFLADSEQAEPEVSEQKRDFFRKTTTGECASLNVEYDAIVAALVGQIEETFMQHFATEVEMKKEQKEELFAGLIGSLDDDDVSLLIEQIVEQNRHEIIIDALNLYIPEEESEGQQD